MFLASIPINIGINLNCRFLGGSFKLNHHLGTKSSHLESSFATLGKLDLFLVKHPLIRSEGEVFTVDYKGQVTKLVFVLALDEVGSSRDTLLFQFLSSKTRNRSQRSSRIKSDEALLLSSRANIHRFSANLNIIKRYSKHILELDR